MDEDFYTGYRKTILEPSEVLINILIPFTEEVIKKGKLVHDLSFLSFAFSIVCRKSVVRF